MSHPKGKPPSRVEVKWAGGNRFDGGRPGRPAIRIDGSSETGPGPVDVLMCALAACTAEDVISILEKRRTPVTSLRIEAEGIRENSVPARITSATLTYHIDGEGIDGEHASRAVQLAVEKYCSVRSSLDPETPVVWKVVVNNRIID